MKDLLISPNQPAIGHAYSAKAVGRTNKQGNQPIVYEGYKDGMHLVRDTQGTTFRAFRTSAPHQKPEFQYDVEDIVK